jgi:hypothetical protein
LLLDPTSLQMPLSYLFFFIRTCLSSGILRSRREVYPMEITILAQQHDYASRCRHRYKKQSLKRSIRDESTGVWKEWDCCKCGRCGSGKGTGLLQKLQMFQMLQMLRLWQGLYCKRTIDSCGSCLLHLYLPPRCYYC